MANAKTLRKRIALVAAAAVGVGVLVAAPASAATSAGVLTTSITGGAGSTTAATGNGTAWAPVTANYTYTFTSATVADTATLTGTITTKTPTNGTSSLVDATAVTFGTPSVTTNATAASVANVLTVTPVGTAVTSTVTGTVTFTPDAPGTFVLTLTPNAVGATPVTDTFTVAGSSAFVGGTLSSNATLGASTQAYSVTSAKALTQVVGGVATLNFASSSTATSYNVAVSGGTLGTITTHTGNTWPTAGTTATPTPSVPTAIGYNVSSSGFSYAPTNNASDWVTLQVLSSVAGTSTVSVTPIGANGVPGTAITATVTWTATPSLSTQYSTAFIGLGAAAATANALVVSLPKTAGVGAAQANITVTLKDGTPLALNGQTLTATISGPGLLSINNGTAGALVGTARAISVTLTGNTAQVGITADGTAGASTITVSVGSTVLATKTLTFYGAVTKLVATQNLSVAVASSTGGTLGLSAAAPAGTSVATTPAVTIVATDANGNVVPGLTITGLSSDATVLASATVTESNGLGAGDGYAGAGSYNASVTSAVNGTSGKSATMTFRTQLADGSYVTATPVTFTLGKTTVATLTMAFDKASYALGEKAKFTITAKDSAGNPVADGNSANLFTAAGVTSNISVSGSTLPGTDVSFVGGSKTYSVFAPSVAGAFTFSGTVDGVLANAVAALGGTTVTAKATVVAAPVDTSAADAAAAAAKAASAAVAALSVTVASLIASVTAQLRALSIIIKKIQKKLNIK